MPRPMAGMPPCNRVQTPVATLSATNGFPDGPIRIDGLSRNGTLECGAESVPSPTVAKRYAVSFSSCSGCMIVRLAPLIVIH